MTSRDTLLARIDEYDALHRDAEREAEEGNEGAEEYASELLDRMIEAAFLYTLTTEAREG